jgi:type IV pilus assembly protein PilV
MPFTLYPSYRGATLLEVLVAMLVMSIGLLGMAALQVAGTRANVSAWRHSQAVWLAYDMADRMRANQEGVANDRYGATGSTVSTASATNCSTGSCDCDTSTANCNDSNMADFDLYEWGQQIKPAMGFPNGVGTITGLGDGRYRIRVMWDDDTAGVASAEDTKGCPSDSTITQTCVEITVQP